MELEHRTSSLRRAVVAIVATATAAGLLLVGPTGPAGAVPASFPNTPIASDRVNGVGYATLLVGDTIYLGGEFTQVRGDNGVVIANRANIVAFDANTGRMRAAFNANTNGRVNALATDGSKLFLGGSFTTVNSMSRGRVAAVDLGSGALRTDWVANASSIVYSLSVGGNRLFVGGAFSTIKNAGRSRVAALSLGNGDVDPTFNPNANNTVLAVRATNDGSRVYVAGNFTVIGGGSRSYLVSLSPTSGALVNPVMSNLTYPVFALDLNAAESRIAAAVAGYGNRGQFINAATGARLFSQTCGGDAQGISVIEDSMFTGFHEECGGNFSIRLTSNNTTNGQRDTAFTPSFDRFWGVQAIDGNYATLAVAGDFTNVGGRPVQGLAIFKSGSAPPPPPPVVAKSMGSGWRYRDNGTDQGTAWRAPGFNDSAWASGNAQLGYGDGDESTVVGFGPNASNKYITTYFRSTFPVTGTPSAASIDIVADDGAVVYVNGTEVARDNMQTGTVTYTTRAFGNQAEENGIRSYPLPVGVLTQGTNTIAVSVHQDSPSSSDVSFDAGVSLTYSGPPPPTTTTTTTTTTSTTTTLPPPAPVSFPLGSTWRYLDNGSDQGTAWRGLGFNDATWVSGPGQLGYGDGDEARVVSFGPNAAQKYRTTYFRRVFNASAVPSTVSLSMIADDGAVVYVNGVEVARDNMPAGTITSATFAASNRSGGGENTVRTFAVPASSIVVGANVIAVEVHQDAANSSDLSFDAGMASTP